MVNAWYSLLATWVLSTTSKFSQMRRKYAISTDMRSGSSCCTPAENSQFDGRWPQPVRTSGSYCTAALVEPNEFCATAPHSPLRALFVRSQSGMKFLFVSLQDRDVVVCKVRIGFGLVPR